MYADNIIWGVKKVPTYPCEWKVYPSNKPEHWERNDPAYFHKTQPEALTYAKKLNGTEN